VLRRPARRRPAAAQQRAVAPRQAAERRRAAAPPPAVGRRRAAAPRPETARGPPTTRVITTMTTTTAVLRSPRLLQRRRLQQLQRPRRMRRMRRQRFIQCRSWITTPWRICGPDGLTRRKHREARNFPAQNTVLRWFLLERGAFTPRCQRKSILRSGKIWIAGHGARSAPHCPENSIFAALRAPALA
jgi:hypothetical protein